MNMKELWFWPKLKFKCLNHFNFVTKFAINKISDKLLPKLI